VLSGSDPGRSTCRVRIVLAAGDVARIVAEMRAFCCSKTFSYIIVEAEPGKTTTMVRSSSNQEDARLFIKRFEKFARLERI
jgi:hypothetical protein